MQLKSTQVLRIIPYYTSAINRSHSPSLSILLVSKKRLGKPRRLIQRADIASGYKAANWSGSICLLGTVGTWVLAMAI